MGERMDAWRRNGEWEKSCWAGNQGILPAEVLHCFMAENSSSYFGRSRLCLMLLGLDQAEGCNCPQHQAALWQFRPVGFHVLSGKAWPLYRLCVRSDELRGLWWEIERDQCAQENHWTKMVPGTAAAHIWRPPFRLEYLQGNSVDRLALRSAQPPQQALGAGTTPCQGRGPV